MLGTMLHTLISMTPCKLLYICKKEKKTDTSLIPLPRNVPNILGLKLLRTYCTAIPLTYSHWHSSASVLGQNRRLGIEVDLAHSDTKYPYPRPHLLIYAEKTAGEAASLMFSVSLRGRYISAVWPSFQSWHCSNTWLGTKHQILKGTAGNVKC